MRCFPARGKDLIMYEEKIWFIDLNSLTSLTAFVEKKIFAEGKGLTVTGTFSLTQDFDVTSKLLQICSMRNRDRRLSAQLTTLSEAFVSGSKFWSQHFVRYAALPGKLSYSDGPLEVVWEGYAPNDSSPDEKYEDSC